MKKPPDSIAVKTNGDFSDLRSSTELPTIDSSSSGRSELPALAKEVARLEVVRLYVGGISRKDGFVYLALRRKELCATYNQLLKDIIFLLNLVASTFVMYCTIQYDFVSCTFNFLRIFLYFMMFEYYSNYSEII
ncbi:uncharacterized protein LOC141718152 isoform X1 [Apium graveolens]|uniref:uncharacterized protein LOC141718152 isoform X1 n=1 Tax=Apium graveolens TaxID=4045 RepID=UPI003D7B5AD5